MKNIDLLKEWSNTQLQRYSPQTKRSYSKSIRLYFKEFYDREPKDITEKDVLNWAIMLSDTPTVNKSPRSAKSVKNTLSCLSSYFEWCIAKGFCDDNPCKSEYVSVRINRYFRQSKEKKFNISKSLSIEEVNKLISASYRKNYEFGLAVEFLVHTAVRVGELAALQWGDIEKNMVIINKTCDEFTREIVQSAKWQSNGKIELNSLILKKLNHWKNLSNSYFIFPYVRNYQRAFSKQIAKIAKKNNIKSCSAHTLRHTSLTLLAIAGHATHEIQRVARHSSITMTSKYIDSAKLTTLGILESVNKILNKC